MSQNSGLNTTTPDGVTNFACRVTINSLFSRHVFLYFETSKISMIWILPLIPFAFGGVCVRL